MAATARGRRKNLERTFNRGFDVYYQWVPSKDYAATQKTLIKIQISLCKSEVAKLFVSTLTACQGGLQGNMALYE